MKKTVTTILSLVLLAAAAVNLRAGGVLETFDITAGTPSPIPGQVLARAIGIRWDDRAIPVKYRVNSFADPVPNPLGGSVLTLAQARTALQESFDAWNDLPTSYIDMRIVGTVTNSGLRGFDMINELTFNTAASFAAIASSPSVSLIRDSTFVAGDDIDGDGDSDVSAAITVTTDVDNDGDLEFPAGFYKAGTILDNDVQFNTKVSNGLRFTIGDAALDTVTRSVDLHTVAIHEFGHSHGLSHSMINQTNDASGDGATMFPFIDTGDPASELQQRTLHTDDIAWSSYLYQEGSASSGLAALQAGDVAFDNVFGLIKGEVFHGTLNGPIAGASVQANEKHGDATSSGFSGTVDLSFNPATGQLFVLPTAAQGVLNGNYVIPVPKGSYAVGVEAVDGTPVATGSISFTAQVGGIYGQQNFNEEFYNKNKEGDQEVRPGQDKNVHVNPGKTKDGIDIVTNDAINITGGFGALNAIGFINTPAGLYYAVRVPAADVSAVNPGGDILAHSALFETFLVDASTVPVYAEAMLTTGTVNANGTATIDLLEPLDREELFVGQDSDAAPLFLKNPHELGRRIRRGIDNGEIQNLFLVLRLPTATPFPGVSAQPPLIGLSTAAPILGRSYLSTDGVTFTPTATFNFRFSLVLAVAN
jgi:hypothetical protein